MTYALTLTFALAACFGLQSLALNLVEGRTTKSESNFFSSIARIQTGAAEPVADVFLLGSSRTGRLPGRSEEFTTVANLGCDAGTALVTLRAIDKGILPLPPILIIEGSTLVHGLGLRGKEISVSMDSPWFNVGRKVPNLGASARPSAFAYSTLLERKVRRADDGEKAPLAVDSKPVIASATDVTHLPQDAEDLVSELSQLIKRFQSKGTKILIVQLPPGAAPESLNTRLPYALSQQAGVPILDLSRNLPPGTITYTDGIHMAPASAAATLRSILAALENL
jgi:hypothetical protein